MGQMTQPTMSKHWRKNSNRGDTDSCRPGWHQP